MTLHKLSAGGGYTYLTKQVARLDAQGVRGGDLGGYYSGQGETPGRWLGAALPDLGEAPGAATVAAGDVVTEAQMLAVFGHGRHPHAEAIAARELGAGATAKDADRAGRLGRAFPGMEPLSDFRTRCAAEYADAGCTEATPEHEQQRAGIRSAVARQMFTAEFGRAPVDGRELNGFIIRATRRAAPVAGYDLTFSPVKSVSTLWALAPVPVARVIEAAHDAAVAETVAWLEAEAVYTRLGRGGVRQVRPTGLLATAFTHRDTRSGDPDLHTHVAISNKVRSAGSAVTGHAGDGPAQWLALDGRVLHKAAVAASERYNTALEAQLRARLGVRFTERAGTDPRKRPVREIAGIPTVLMTAWSSRRAAIDVARAGLEKAFQARHGRPPTPAESIKLAQQANLSTRAAKHEPRAEADQRAQWRAQAVTVLAGGPPTHPGADRRRVDAAVEEIDRLLETARAQPGPPAADLTPAWVQVTAAQVLGTVAGARATWQQWHLMAEMHRAVRAANIDPAHRHDAYAQVLAAALSPAHSVPLGSPDPISEPQALRRPPTPDTAALRDRAQSDRAGHMSQVGQSVYEVAGMTYYTSAAVLAAERRVLALASQGGAGRIGDTDVDLALLESAANGRDLNPAQAAMVRAFATSGARVQLAIAPAGSGKTTATSVLARAWTSAGGDVIGLSPTAAAASVLAEQTGSTCDTLAKIVHALTNSAHNAAHQLQQLGGTGGSPSQARSRARMPVWAHQVGPHTLVIVDEAGMASTGDLDVALGWLTGRGAVIRLIGDDQQLASVSCGGLLRDIATTSGALTLSELVRFADPAEGNATIALREGDRTAIGFWLDNDRVAVGGAQTMTEITYQQWKADVAAGADSIMLAPRRDIVAA